MDLSLTLPTSSVVVRPEPKADLPRRQLLTPLPEPGEFLLVLDNTALEKFTTCPTAARNYLVLGREAHARNAALTFGGAIHAGLEAFLKGEGEDATTQAVLRYFTENPAPHDEYRTPQNAVDVLRHYAVRSTFPDYAWEIKSDAVGPLIERAFELPIGVIEVESRIKGLQGIDPHKNIDETEGGVWVSRIHVAWSGRIDVVATIGGLTYVVDHKTSSIDGDQFIQDFILSNQTQGYVWAGRQLWPDLDIAGFQLNAIRVKKPSAGCGLMDKGPRGGAPALHFYRVPFEYTPSRISQWHNNALLIVEDFVASLVRNEFPMHTKWCFGKYGRCPYHEVCTIDDPGVRLNVLMSDQYKAVTWNPTADRT